VQVVAGPLPEKSRAHAVAMRCCDFSTLPQGEGEECCCYQRAAFGDMGADVGVKGAAGAGSFVAPQSVAIAQRRAAFAASQPRWLGDAQSGRDQPTLFHGGAAGLSVSGKRASAAAKSSSMRRWSLARAPSVASAFAISCANNSSGVGLWA